MTKEQIEQLLNTRLSKLAEECRDPQMLAMVLSITYNQGYKIGQKQAHRFYHTMFAGYDETTINYFEVNYVNRKTTSDKNRRN